MMRTKLPQSLAMRLPTMLAFTAIAIIAPLARPAELTELATATPVTWNAKYPYLTAVAREPATGRVWVGTEKDGVWCNDGGGAEWKQFTAARHGLGDDTVYGLAVDRQGRVWAGHAGHGVSVYDGAAWRNYDVTTGGPLGSRVFAIKVCPAGPRAGEVWLATDGGLARYSPADDAWTYATRADGLPADQIQCLAFNPADGRAMLGTQCDGLAIAGPADDYATWTTVPGPTRPGVEPVGDGLPSCMINDVLVTRDGAIFVATPWGLGKSADDGKTFTFRRGLDWFAKARQRTGGAPAGVKATKDLPLLAEDYVNCLAEDAVGLLWIGYRTAGYESVDESAWATRHAAAFGPAPGKPGECVTRILPLFDAGPLVATYGGGLLQSEKYFTCEAAFRPAPVAAAEAVKHPAPAKAPSGRAFDKVQARLNALKPEPPLTAAFLGDDWTTEGDWMGRYGRQVFAFPFYGAGGWAQGYKLDVKIGPHESKNKGGPFTFYRDDKVDTTRVLYIPNAAKRYPGEWNDGSFDRDAYHDEWEGPDLWLDVTVPAGTHRMSLYCFNYDSHGPPANRRRDFLIEVKAHAPTVAEADFAPALARARAAQLYHGVYKQFALAGPAQYYVKINRNYSFATKLCGVFFDRLAGPVPANEPQGVPLMGDVQVKPPPMPAGAGTPNVATRAAADVIAALDKNWASADAVALQRPYRLLAIRLAAEQGAAEAVTDNWRFALPVMTMADHQAFAKVVAESREQMFDRNPNMVETPFRTKMTAAWKRIEPLVKAGNAPDPAKLLNTPATTPDEIKAALAPYLLLRAGQAIDTRSLATDAQTPDAFAGDFKGAAADPKLLYRLTGEYLLYSDALAGRKSEKARRQALASAMATTRAVLDLMDDTWLAARVAQAFLLPQLATATPEAGPMSREAVLATVIAAHTNDPAALAAALKRITNAAKGEAADSLRLEIARAFHVAGRDRDAAKYLDEMSVRTPEAEALRKELRQ